MCENMDKMYQGQPSGPMKVDRHQAVLEYVLEHGGARISVLARHLGVSEMTLRRDMEELEKRGRLKRVHGGAILASGGDSGYWLRHRQAQEEKRQIAQLAASLVHDAQTVYLDTGTTALELARALAARSLREGLKIKVATHAVNVATELANAPALSVYLVGGQVSTETLGTFGPDAVREISRLHVDMFFLAVTGVHIEQGFTNSSAVGLEVKRTLVRRARSTYVIADSFKWERTSLLTICGFDEVTGWVTDAKLPALAARQVRKRRLRLLNGS